MADLDYDALWQRAIEEATATAKLCYPEPCEPYHEMIGRESMRLYHEFITPPRRCCG